MINNHVRETLACYDEVYVSDALYGGVSVLNPISVPVPISEYDTCRSESSEYSDLTEQYPQYTQYINPCDTYEVESNTSNASVEDNIHEFYCGY